MIYTGIKRSFLIVAGAILLYQLWIFAHVWWWIDHNPTHSAFMDQRLNLLQQKNPDAQLRFKWVAYNQISNNLKRALIAAEDSKFLTHDGFDWKGIHDAAEKDLKKGRLVAGGSTITQQLAKNLFLSGQRTPWRKLQEAIITVMLEKMMGKRRILEIYMNVIEWGNSVFGAQAASYYYYHTTAANLSVIQAARLAAMVPDPRYYDLHRNARGLLRRTATIAARMPLVSAPK